MAPVGGQPFLAHLLEQLALQGITNAVLCTGYLAESVQDYFGDRFSGVSLTYSREVRPLGTGGALAQALPLLRSSTILVLNGDSYLQTDFHHSLVWHQQHQAKATVVLARVENTRRFGRVEVTPEGNIIRFCEKCETQTAGWINGGVYWFERAVLANVSLGDAYSLERDVLATWSGPGLCGLRNLGCFIDIGTPGDYARAGEFIDQCHAATSISSI
jgi:NDP-sugar pyrophosphorylase family protein